MDSSSDIHSHNNIVAANFYTQTEFTILPSQGKKKKKTKWNTGPRANHLKN